MTTAPQQATSHTSRVAGYLLALSAGATWGTTGPLSTGLYRLMPATSIGFWRVLIGTVCLALWGLAFRRELFRVDGRGWLLVGVGGGFLVALFEVAYQFAIAGVGVAGAAALLYTAPVLVAVLRPPGPAPGRPPRARAWGGGAGLTAGSVLAANLLFSAAVKRIGAAPAAVAATIEPVVGTLLALAMFNQRLSALGSLGLCMVVGGVAAGYLNEAKQGGH